MRFFLDMNVLIYHGSEDNSFFYKKTAEFIKKNENGTFLICYYIFERDLPKWFRRQRTLIDEVSKKIKDSSYDLNSSKEWASLYPWEKRQGEKLILKAGFMPNKELFIKILLDSNQDMEINILNFIKLRTEKVIPLSEIDQQLKSALFVYVNDNISDANIMASGIQEHNSKELVMITADKEDWTEASMGMALPDYSALSKKYPKVPKISYIQDT